jgi:hypothetical protein
MRLFHLDLNRKLILPQLAGCEIRESSARRAQMLG